MAKREGIRKRNMIEKAVVVNVNRMTSEWCAFMYWNCMQITQIFALSLILQSCHTQQHICQSIVCICIIYYLYAMHTNDVEMRRDRMYTTHEHENPFAINVFDCFLVVWAIHYSISFASIFSLSSFSFSKYSF